MGLVYKNILKGDSILGLWYLSETLEEMFQLASLSDSDLLKLKKKVNDKRKKESLAAQILLNQLLDGSHEITHDIHGRPFLSTSDFGISISHSGSYAVIYLVKEKPAGVDIQKVKTDIGKGIDFFLNEEEQLWVDNTDFFLMNILWSAKESVYKYAGIPDLDPRNNISADEFLLNSDGEITINFGKDIQKKISIHYEVFEDYILTRTL